MSTPRYLISPLLEENARARRKLLAAVHAGELDGHAAPDVAWPDSLGICLEFAVPLWVQRFRDERLTLDQVLERGREAGRTLAEKGDVLQFGGTGCAKAFDALAEGLAAGSFVPGGIRFAGVHFQSDPAWLLEAA